MNDSPFTSRPKLLENKIGFVHFALLTAIALWDDAMDKAEANRKKLAEIEAQKEQARKEFRPSNKLNWYLQIQHRL